MIAKRKIIALFMILSTNTFLFADDTPAKQDGRIVDEKALLKLPYDKEPVYVSNNRPLPDFSNFAGLGDFAVLTKPRPKTYSGMDFLEIEVCSSDLSVFKVSFGKPMSCKVACDHMFEIVAGEDVTADRSNLFSYIFPRLDGDKYIVESKLATPRVLSLNIRMGVLIRVEFSPRNGLKSPVNQEVLVAQMNALIDELFALIDGDKRMADDKSEYYKKLKASYLAARSRPDVSSTPANATKFDLFLSEVPPEEKTGTGIPFEMKTPQKVIAHKPYLVARADGKAILLVKIADQKKVITDAEDAWIAPENISDIQFWGTLNGGHIPADVSLRTDGQYQVTFYKHGKQSLNVGYLDNDGKVVQMGTLEVEVEENVELMDKLMKRYPTPSKP